MKNKLLLILILTTAIITGCAKNTNLDTTVTLPAVETTQEEQIKEEKEEVIEGEQVEEFTPEIEIPEEKLDLEKTEDEAYENGRDWAKNQIQLLGLQKHREIQVDGGNLSGHRESLVKVNVGFGKRDYWAFTNEHGQLTHVIAEVITLQDDKTEPVKSNGRYYNDEAKVPGVESKTLDEGHVIADSLGGVSNAYNITPQDSTLNRHGDQAYMEKVIRQANGATHFVAVIEYPNTDTHIPSHYNYDYTVKGNQVKDSYPNGNPEGQANSKPVGTKPDIPKNEVSEPSALGSSDVKITLLDKISEQVEITNTGVNSTDISGWKIVSEVGNQSFVFPNGSVIESGKVIKITSGAANGTGDYTMAKGNVWNNSTEDPAVLYNNSGLEVSRVNK